MCRVAQANRRKLQHKEVQKQREEELREAKLRAEREQKEKERQEPRQQSALNILWWYTRFLYRQMRGILRDVESWNDMNVRCSQTFYGKKGQPQQWLEYGGIILQSSVSNLDAILAGSRQGVWWLQFFSRTQIWNSVPLSGNRQCMESLTSPCWL